MIQNPRKFMMLKYYLTLNIFVYCETIGILTERETSETDSVSLSTYKSYIDAAGGMCVAAMVLMVYGVSSGSVVFSEWWLGIWIEQTVGITNLIRYDQSIYNAVHIFLPL